MVASMPEAARDIMQKVVFGDTIYRDRQYVVGELQSLAAQLNAVAVFLPAPPQQRRQ
jgi:hypothetical protein